MVVKRALLKTTHELETMRSPTWETDTAGKIQKWLQLDGRRIRLTPLVVDDLSGDTDIGATIRVDYIQAPKPLTTLSTVPVTALEVGKWYEIASAGDTTWTTVGLDTSTEEGSYGQFKATAVGTGTGTVYEIIDPRIYPEHQPYLKYAAAAFLLHLEGTPAAIQKADKYMQTFFQLIGA